MKQKKLCIIFIILNSFAFAQTKPQNKILSIPQKYNVPKENVTLEKTNLLIPGTKWEVFPDKNYTRTYTKPNGKKLKNILNYLEKYYVNDENDNYIHLIKETDSEKDTNLYEDIGWIEKENMLLWKHCLVNENNFVDIKAILIRNDYNSNLFEQNIEKKTITENSVEHDYQIFYVLKKTKTSVLLSKLPMIFNTYSNISEYVIGWVPIEDVIIWDNVNVLEPNWLPEAANERKTKNIKASIFSEKKACKTFMNGKSSNNKYVLWDNDTYTERKPGNWLRFPVLNNKKGIIKTIIKNKNNNTCETNSYCSFKNKNSKFPIFKKVLLLKGLEVSVLLSFQKDIINCFSKPDPREKLCNLFKSIYNESNWTQENENVSEILTNDVCQIQIGAFNSKGILFNYKINDFTDKAKINNKLLEDYKTQVITKYNELDKIFNEYNYPFSFSMNGVTYYWISEDFLP